MTENAAEIYMNNGNNDKNNKKFNFHLEGMRGLAAIAVGFSHIFGIENLLDPHYQPNLYFLNIGRSAVLIFFIMSGYVIGLTNQTTYSNSKAKNYLLRRIVRLFPIYSLAVILGFLAIPKFTNIEDIVNILGNLLFLQKLFVEPIAGNTPVWSLNYEVIYYLLFLVIWWLRLNIPLLMLICLIISAIGIFSASFPSIILGYASGFFFWLSGLWIAVSCKSAPTSILENTKHKNYHQFPILSYIFLFYASHQLNIGSVITQSINYKASFSDVSISDIITIFPLAIVIISKVTHRHFFLFKWLNYLAFLMPIIFTIFLLITGRFQEPRWFISVVFICFSILLLPLKISLDSLIKFKFLGHISYGFYLVHFPIIFFIHDFFPISGSLASFWIRAILWLAITVLISSFLELFLQPKIKIWFQRRGFINKHT